METSDARDLGVLGHGYHDCTEVGRCILPLRSSTAYVCENSYYENYLQRPSALKHEGVFHPEHLLQ